MFGLGILGKVKFLSWRCRICIQSTDICWMSVMCQVQRCWLFILQVSWICSFPYIRLHFNNQHSDPVPPSTSVFYHLYILHATADLLYVKSTNLVQVKALHQSIIALKFFCHSSYGHTCVFTFIVIDIDDSHIWVFAYPFSTFPFMKAFYTWLPSYSVFAVTHIPDKWTEFW